MILQSRICLASALTVAAISLLGVIAGEPPPAVPIERVCSARADEHSFERALRPITSPILFDLVGPRTQADVGDALTERISLGSTNASSNRDLVALFVGVGFQATDHVEIGAAYELDLVYRF